MVASLMELCPRCGAVMAEGAETCGCEREPSSARGTELELDDPRPRPPADFDAPEASPLATRWHVGDQEIVADQDPLNGAMRVWVSGRRVSANGFTLTRTHADYRGSEQAEARVRFDRATNSFSLRVGRDEIVPHSAPAPSPPSKPQIPPSPDAPPHALMIVLGVVFVVGFVVALVRFMARRDVVDHVAIERETTDCLRKADQAAEEARAGTTKQDMAAEARIADERRLARIACKDRERECKRDPKSIVCVLGAK